MLSLGATAGEISSAYTDLDLERCRVVDQSQGEGSWIVLDCPGYGNERVRVAEDDLRVTVSYGKDAETACAAQQTFGHFNSTGPRIEWRLEDGKPFATILRWNESVDETTVSWLVVSKYDGAEACHVAYVHPATPDANGIARAKADELARGFSCSRDTPQVISPSPRKAEEIVSGIPCPVE
jgi:hypothetical protein